MTESDESKNVVTDSPDAATREKPEVRKKRRRWVVILRYVAVSALALVLLSSIGIGAGEYYTSQPNFCASCHNMEPYYDSWSHDIHGAKLGVKCVDCHYAPGEKFTFKAKFKGLSQAASYFSGRSGASRPRAHVSDASCTTSRCHGDEAYLTKPLLLGERRVEMRRFGDRDIEITRSPTVLFSHDVHIGANDRLAETELRLKELSAELESAMPADEFGRLREVAISVGPPDRREAELRQILVESRNEDVSESALELMRLEHARTRLLQLSGMTCATCHTYDASGTRHFTVDLQTCYTCHFTNEAFNRETAACLTCHEPPSRPIMVHDRQGATPTRRRP